MSAIIEKKERPVDSPYRQSYEMARQRQLPQNADAEKGVLCSALIGTRDLMEELLSRLTPEHFHIPAHASIWHIQTAMHRGGLPSDFITLTEQLESQGLLGEVGGPAFVSDLFTWVPTAANAGYYADIVQEKHTLRAIIATCTDAVSRAYDEQDNVTGLLDDVQAGVMRIAQEAAQEDAIRDLASGVDAAIDRLENAYNTRGQCIGISSGLNDLDGFTSGWRNGQMIVFGASTSMGKTSLMMQCLKHAAMNLRLPVAIFSLEMGFDELADRELYSEARVSLQRARDGFLSDADFPRITEAAARLKKTSPIYVDDTPGLNIFQLRAKARRLVMKHGVRLIAVDYLQLIEPHSKQTQDNRVLALSEVSRGIKRLAKELNIPILIGAQLNRKPDERKQSVVVNPEARDEEDQPVSVPRYGVPQISDLRECGAIGHDADIVALLYRAHYFSRLDEDKGWAQCIFAKQRNGPVGTAYLKFIADETRFESVRSKLYSNNAQERQPI